MTHSWKLKPFFSAFYECQDQSSTYRRGLGGNFQPFFRWFPCPHIYDLSNRIFHQHRNGPHQRTSRFSFVLPIYDWDSPWKKHKISNLGGHSTWQENASKYISMKQLNFVWGTKTLIQNNHTEAKLLLQLTSTEMLTPPENLQLLHLKNKTFSYIWSYKTT